MSNGLEGIILLVGIIFIVCIIFNKISNKIGVPVLLVFIVLGMLSGSDGILKIDFSDVNYANELCSTALIFIMFYGGFGTNWKSARPVAAPSIFLSTVGVLITALLTGAFCHYILKISWVEGMLIGSVISSTDAASMFSILRSRSLNLKHNLASMLEVESGSNDPMSYMLTVIFLSLLSGEQGNNYLVMVIKQVGFGIFFGVAIAYLSFWVFKRIKFESIGLQEIFVIAIALLGYALPSKFGGNGYLSVYIMGIILGNNDIPLKVEMVHFFDGITWIMQILLFFVIGLLSFPSQLPSVLFVSLAIALFLTFVARPLAVFGVLSWFKLPFKRQLLVAWAGLRGAASIVFAMMAVVSNASMNTDIFHIVFCVALISVALQGTLLPTLAKKLDLVDNSDSVLKTFNDYQEEKVINLIDFHVTGDHKWIGKPLKEIELPNNLLVVMIKRESNTIIPNGDTQIEADDVLVMNSSAYIDNTDIPLYELCINTDHPWVEQTLQNIDLPEHTLIIMIKRNNDFIVPKGDTILYAGDKIITNREIF